MEKSIRMLKDEYKERISQLKEQRDRVLEKKGMETLEFGELNGRIQVYIKVISDLETTN